MKTLVKILLAIVFIIAIVLNCMSASYAAEPTESEPIYSASYVNHVQAEYFNSQFLVTIAQNGHYEVVKDFLWLIDNSVYDITIENWNKFQRRYTKFLQAKRALRQGWNVEFDDFLN